MKNDNIVKTKLDRPIIFRTVGPEVYEKSIKTGAIWLRSSQYYRNLEDKIRNDPSEGANGSKTPFPLNFKPEGGNSLSIQEDGSIGCEIVPHYLVSMHGSSISEMQRMDFGGCTFGIKCIYKLSAEILYQVSKQIPVTGYRFGQVSYQYTALSLSYNPMSSAIGLGGTPPVCLKSINTDVLRKEPVKPFIEQDEWRIAVFSPELVGGDPNEPLKINVDPDHFFEYISFNN